MGLIPIDKMWERVEITRQDSDTSLFLTLMYFGEMVVKLVGAGCVTAIENDRERHQYRQIHRLVRADGIGEWAAAVDDILTGPASQHLNEVSRQEQRELTSKNGSGTWQFDSVRLLHDSISIVEPHLEQLGTKVDGRRWLSLFARLRNETRGHGAFHPEACGQICPLLERSIRLFTENFGLFSRPWAYLYRNLSGKYRITKFTQPSTEFDLLKTSHAANNSLQDGVYVYFDQPRPVELICSGVEAQDFFFPNGGFNDKTFELLSYISNTRINADAAPYLAPATPLPSSETQGIGVLEDQGEVLGNLPPVQAGYVSRRELEAELFGALMIDRHPIITLVGSGGIGKTWLTLNVLHEISRCKSYTALLWFSARDIDLLLQGPKLVAPHVLTINDIAKEFVHLVQPSDAEEKGFSPTAYLAEQMTKSNFGPILFVFDNFETVRVPAELFAWIDTYIRLPNKVLITSRVRDFRGDYPIEVSGMNETESEELIQVTAKTLNITHLLTEDYKHELHQESGGHPYVMKVLLGEVAKAGKLSKVDRIVATMEGILDALFERTFSGLSPAAKRVFLTLCSWHSTVPQLALEAVLLRPSNERMDVASAAEELSRSSFIEISTSSDDKELFLSVPLVAEVFGKRKLATSPMRSSIDADRQLLQAFGAAQQADIKKGISPRIDRLFRYIADRIAQGKEDLALHLPMLEFIAYKYSPAWLLMSRLCQELNEPDKAKESLRRYIESGAGDDFRKEEIWQNLVLLCQKTEDPVGEIHSLVEMCQLPNIPFHAISAAVNRVNALFSEKYGALDSDEKHVVSLRMAQVMEARLEEADATDCSRLGWLFLRLGDDAKALEIARAGLLLDADNTYCSNLLSRIQSRRF